MPIIGEATAGLVSGLAGPLFGLVDELFTSDEERAAAKLKLMEMEQRGDLDRIKVQMSAIIAEAQSEDPYTSRARPTFLYVIYSMIMLCVVGSIAGVFYPAEVSTAANNLDSLLNAIPDSLYGLFGVGYLGYTGFRSWDKQRGLTNGK